MYVRGDEADNSTFLKRRLCLGSQMSDEHGQTAHRRMRTANLRGCLNYYFIFFGWMLCLYIIILILSLHRASEH